MILRQLATLLPLYNNVICVNLVSITKSWVIALYGCRRLLGWNIYLIPNDMLYLCIQQSGSPLIFAGFVTFVCAFARYHLTFSRGCSSELVHALFSVTFPNIQTLPCGEECDLVVNYSNLSLPGHHQWVMD